MKTDIEMSIEIGGLNGSLHWDAETRALIHSDVVSTALVATNVDATFVQWVMEAWAGEPARLLAEWVAKHEGMHPQFCDCDLLDATRRAIGVMEPEGETA